jgi:hypothetical protein
MPDAGRDVRTLEPFVKMEILTPSEYNGVSTHAEARNV